MSPPRLSQVLFDEAHREAWTIRPELAARMQPSHPGDSSLARAAALLRTREFHVVANRNQTLADDTLARTGVLVLAHPSEDRWERTTGVGAPRLSAAELDAVERFVHRGGGLIVLGETEQDKYGNNLNDLLARFGLALENHTVQDYVHNLGAPSWVLASLDRNQSPSSRGDVLARVRDACLYRATTISARNGAHVIARTHRTASVPEAPLIALTHHGAGHVAVLADSDLFGDDCIDQLSHRQLWLNLIFWAAAAEPADPRRSVIPAARSAWRRLRDETNALARLQAPDGSLLGDPANASGHRAEISAALGDLRRHFPHQDDYLAAAVADLDAWDRSGFGRPDFSRSLDLFRPELRRVDGTRHLVFFPMYKQNGSRDTCFEALVIRTPWPDWIAELERKRYDNPKFVPVQLVDGTHGYDSECAVLFPEMVAVGPPPVRPVNHFGAIFCDREAARLRRIGGQAVERLRLSLPPDAARLLESPKLSEQAYVLWDLIHDRTHSHGELPFDPFMIRQRAPYWMYSLEELRCDLTAFAEAMVLEAEGVGFAAHVQYAILLDRLLRFPITGSRVRNYDGLGGQLLFAHLHRGHHLEWRDNRLTIDWERIPEGVTELREEIEALYRAGIDRTRLAHWAAAHDLIAAVVPPAAGSRWAAAARSFPESADPRPYVDQVLPDEFPLSIFFSSLKTELRL